jgi:hypothetical protein
MNYCSCFSMCLSEDSSYLALILVDDFDGFDDRKLAVASFTNALAGCQTNCPSAGRAYRFAHAITDAFVFHGETRSGMGSSSSPHPT